MSSFLKLKHFQKLFHNLILLFLGIFFFFAFVPIFTIVSFPFGMYRLFVHKVIAPCFQPDVGKPVTSLGTLFATEFLNADKTKPIRCAIVVNFVIQGKISYADAVRIVEKNWISPKLPNGQLRNPEYQQYISKWMGYMFWKQDKSFSIKNHIILHKLPEQATVSECNKFFCNLMETSLNKPFTPKQSPWELHLVQNYKNPELSQSEEKLTLFVFRLHHAMADGYSVMYSLVDGLMETPTQNVRMASPVKLAKEPVSLSKVWQTVKFPFGVVHEAGLYISYFFRPKTPWHIMDSEKHWQQMYARSELIPIQKLKDVKNRFNVSFTALLLSCISGGIAKSLSESMGMKWVPEEMLMGFNIPLKNHPRKLRNHV